MRRALPPIGSSRCYRFRGWADADDVGNRRLESRCRHDHRPIGNLGDTATAISEQATALAEQNALRTQQAREATDRQAQLTEQASQAQQSQQAVLDRLDERQAQLEAQQDAQQRADDIQAQLEAFGLQRAQLQDAILADQDLQATQEVIADQNTAGQPQSLDQTALNAFLNNNNTTVGTLQDAMDEFQQMEDATGMEVSEVTVTLTRTGAQVDNRL